jgi:hypothetical protein
LASFASRLIPASAGIPSAVAEEAVEEAAQEEAVRPPVPQGALRRRPEQAQGAELRCKRYVNL